LDYPVHVIGQFYLKPERKSKLWNRKPVEQKARLSVVGILEKVGETIILLA